MLRQPFYLDDLIILTNISFKDHLLKLEMRKGSSKTFNHWGESEQPVSNKVETILNIKAPKTRKE
jgi:hypothetical protein